MPMLDAYIPEGALSPNAERELLAKITDVLLEHEGVDPTDFRDAKGEWALRACYSPSRQREKSSASALRRNSWAASLQVALVPSQCHISSVRPQSAPIMVIRLRGQPAGGPTSGS